jgi:hypothetical protein
VDAIFGAPTQVCHDLKKCRQKLQVREFRVIVKGRPGRRPGALHGEMRQQLRRVLDGPEIDHQPGLTDDDIDYDALNATVRIQTRKSRPKRWEVRDALIKTDINMNSVSGIYQQRKTNEWFVQFVNQKEAMDFNGQNDDLSANGQSWSVNMHNQEICTLKCHWMPGYTSLGWFRRYFSQFGEVLGIHRCQMTYPNKSETDGPVQVEMRIGVQERATVPHIVQNADTTSMLITMQGRPPLCLECNTKGHIRRDCPELGHTRLRERFQAQRAGGQGAWGTNPVPTTPPPAAQFPEERVEAIKLVKEVAKRQPSAPPDPGAVTSQPDGQASAPNIPLVDAGLPGVLDEVAESVGHRERREQEEDEILSRQEDAIEREGDEKERLFREQLQKEKEDLEMREREDADRVMALKLREQERKVQSRTRQSEEQLRKQKLECEQRRQRDERDEQRRLSAEKAEQGLKKKSPEARRVSQWVDDVCIDTGIIRQGDDELDLQSGEGADSFSTKGRSSYVEKMDVEDMIVTPKMDMNGTLLPVPSQGDFSPEMLTEDGSQRIADGQRKRQRSPTQSQSQRQRGRKNSKKKS